MLFLAQADFFYKEVWRMDWGLGNPNKTAALIAMLMLAAWIFAWRWGRWGFVIALGLFTGLGICLVHTFSRGGLVALVVGATVLLGMLPRSWSLKRVAAVLASVGLMIGCAGGLGFTERVGQGVVAEDRSITHRWHLWSAAPHMMVAAPEGWGWGESGKAYQQWYQPLEKREIYRTLVNSHLTWLVEGGWAFRLAYIAVWLLVLVTVWGNRGESEAAVALAVWCCWAAALWFSSAGETWWLWLLPLAFLALRIKQRLHRGEGLLRAAWVGVLLMALFLCGVLFWLGAGQAGDPVRRVADGVVCGSGSVDVICLVDTRVMGSNYGRAWREEQRGNKRSPTVLFVQQRSKSDEKSWTGARKLVVVGDRVGELEEWARRYKSAQIEVWNPMRSPREIGLDASLISKMVLRYGPLATQVPLHDWRETSEQLPWAGQGDFIMDWAKELIGL